MIDEEYKILINKALDGELSVKDERQLSAYFEQNPEARNLYHDIKQTSELLNEVPEVDHPHGLKTRILNSIDYSRYTKKAKSSVIKSLFPEWFFAPRAKLAYAFVLGLFFGLIAIAPYLINLAQEHEIDTSHVSGTLKTPENIDFEIIHSIPIERSEISGKINIKKFQFSIMIEFDLDATAETEILIEYNSAQIHFENFEPIGYSKISLDYGQGYLKISPIGSIKTSLYFTQSDSSTQIELNLSHSGNLVLSHPIVLK